MAFTDAVSGMTHLGSLIGSPHMGVPRQPLDQHPQAPRSQTARTAARKIDVAQIGAMRLHKKIALERVTVITDQQLKGSYSPESVNPNALAMSAASSLASFTLRPIAFTVRH